MGVWKYTYVGVYLEIPHQTVEVKKQIRTHPTTGAIMNSDFCPTSGVPALVSWKSETKTKEPYAYIDDVDGLDEDQFISYDYCGGDDYSIFIPNSTKYCLKEDDSTFDLDLSEYDPLKLIIDFKNDNKKYLDYYEKEYGGYTIRFGVVVYEN